MHIMRDSLMLWLLWQAEKEYLRALCDLNPLHIYVEKYALDLRHPSVMGCTANFKEHFINLHSFFYVHDRTDYQNNNKNNKI